MEASDRSISNLEAPKKISRGLFWASLQLPAKPGWFPATWRPTRDLGSAVRRTFVSTSATEALRQTHTFSDLPVGQPLGATWCHGSVEPFIWTKSAGDILQKVIRANSRLSSNQNAALP
ncbi:MAG: hypothetical protein JSR68_15615 [Proteobacteria bacterium]|nr:hypothetical protein [Pseudomonadota bacterium]